MDVHLFNKKTGDLFRIINDIKPGQIIDVEENDPSVVEIVYVETSRPTRWPEGAEL